MVWHWDWECLPDPPLFFVTYSCRPAGCLGVFVFGATVDLVVFVEGGVADVLAAVVAVGLAVVFIVLDVCA